ncbi:S26 family signal peptidase [Caulobacter sp.]|uniref:S26 family signal peptidase n=1 Tax=Caulobacter sp. TaxID=78 RepID=UPI0031E33997
MHRGFRIALLGLIPAPIAAVQAFTPAPMVLVNTSPSEPTGLYIRSPRSPAVGRIIAFRPPPGAYPYVADAMPERARTSILKAVRGGEGDLVCANERRVLVNDQVWPAAARFDRRGRLLPQWRDCRRLAADEVFVLSTRIPNSFDSRYYGPVHRAEILGVYTPLLTSGRPS